MNRHMRELYTDEALTKPCWQFFHNRSAPCEHCKREQLFDENDQPRESAVWEAHEPDDDRWYLHHNRAVRWSDGRYVRLHMVTDISAVKLLEQERIQHETRLRQAQKMEAIGTLAGGIAHDFNNILSAILGYSDMALDDANRGVATPAYIRQILKAGQRARDLVQQILTFSRQSETESKAIQIQPIIKEAIKLLRASLPSTIDINFAMESEAFIDADPVQIHQVFMNLCTNAGHAMRENGGRLDIRIGEETLTPDFTANHPGMQPGPHLKVEVKDSGEGIAPEAIEKIFDPYFTTKPKGEGTGMGLAVAQGIVRSCHGDISVTSAPGQGSTFTAYFPVLRCEKSDMDEPQERELGGCEHILFVDDEPPLTELAKELLERFGYRVTVCNHSPEALTLFEQGADHFDLVITDMTMPKMTGEVLAERIRAFKPGIPIIICTGFSQKVTPEMMQRLDIQALVMKPLIRNELAATIRTALDNGQGKEAWNEN